MIVPVETPSDPRLAAYRVVSEPALARARGQFVAEGRFVVERLIHQRRFGIQSVLVSPAALAAMEHALALLPADVAVFVLPAPHFETVAGFNIHRGCLALAERGAPAALTTCVAGARRLLVLEGIGNPDNMGGIFRNAAAFSVNAVLLGPGCCDPLYRKAIRTSMGASLTVPFAELAAWPDSLRLVKDGGRRLIGLTPAAPSMSLERYAAEGALTSWALLLGNEGDGLSAAALAHCDARVRIPTSDAVDSLNVAVACGIALARLSSEATV